MLNTHTTRISSNTGTTAETISINYCGHLCICPFILMLFTNSWICIHFTVLMPMPFCLHRHYTFVFILFDFITISIWILFCSNTILLHTLITLFTNFFKPLSFSSCQQFSIFVSQTTDNMTPYFHLFLNFNALHDVLITFSEYVKWHGTSFHSAPFYLFIITFFHVCTCSLIPVLILYNSQTHILSKYNC